MLEKQNSKKLVRSSRFVSLFLKCTIFICAQFHQHAHSLFISLKKSNVTDPLSEIAAQIRLKKVISILVSFLILSFETDSGNLFIPLQRGGCHCYPRYLILFSISVSVFLFSHFSFFFSHSVGPRANSWLSSLQTEEQTFHCRRHLFGKCREGQKFFLQSF